MSSRRLAILNANWPLHSSVCYLAGALEKAGYEVDVLLYHTSEDWAGDLFDFSPSLRVHRFGAGLKMEYGGQVEWTGKRFSLRRCLKGPFHLLPPKMREAIREKKEQLLLRIWPEYGLIPRRLVRTVVSMNSQSPYFALIGVEKGGLAWAGAVAQHTGTPLVYYSLELYTWDHPWIRSSTNMKRFKKVEENYHRQCALTVVQDEPRSRVLLADNGVRLDMPVAWLPISLLGSTYDYPSHLLQDDLALPYDRKLLICFGEISERRLSVDLARIAQDLPSDCYLVLHGFGTPEVFDAIRGLDVKRKVCLSLRLVPAVDRQRLVRSAHIGLALYSKSPVNDELTGRSSEKIAMYLQCGLPLIAFRYNSYQHIEAERAGVLIDSLEEIPKAVATILENYDVYVRNAQACYLNNYKFEDNVKGVLGAIERIRR